MWVFLVVVAMLFLGAIMGYLVVRVNPNLEAPFIPEGATGLPVSLVFSTIALMASSYSMHQATLHVRQGRSQEAHWSMTVTMLLACVFLVAQFPRFPAFGQDGFCCGIRCARSAHACA